MNALLSFLPLFRGQASKFGLVVLLGALALLAGIGLLGISGWFLTAAALTTAAASFNLFGPSSLIRAFSFIRIGARYGEKLVGHDATLRLLADLRGWLFIRLFPRMPLKDNGISHGDLVSRLTADIDTLDTAFLVAIGPMLTALVLGSVMSATLAWFIPAGAVIYAVSLALATLVVPVALVAATREQGRRIVKASSMARGVALQTMDGLADFISFDERGLAREQFEDAARMMAATKRMLSLYGSVASALVQLLAGTALFGVLWFGIQGYQLGAIGGPLLVGLLFATLASFEATGTIVRSVSRLSASIAAAEQIRETADSPPAVRDLPRTKPLPSSNAIAFHGVTFGQGAGKPALRDLDLEIAEGTRVAIVGASGSGKSTLLSLLLRLRDPDFGGVTLGEVDLRDLKQDDLHRRIAYLPQETLVFMGSLRENLLVGSASAGDSDLWHMLDAVQLGDDVRRMPDTLDTYVGEKGWTLSAGQARRVCLLRTLLSKAEVLVLDEPTSSLDAGNEKAFFERARVDCCGQDDRRRHSCQRIAQMFRSDLSPGRRKSR
jgi:ATP-binding cassette subfamily C protein CydC